MPERIRLSVICVSACSCHFEVAVFCYKLQWNVLPVDGNVVRYMIDDLDKNVIAFSCI